MQDQYEIVGVAIPEEETMRNPALYADLPSMSVDELLGTLGLQAVAIETSELNLTKYAMMALERGLAVHMDKPGGIILSDFERMIDYVKRNGSVFHMGYMYRYNPAVIRLKQQVDEGKLGDIYSVEAHMDCGQGTEKRHWLSAF